MKKSRVQLSLFVTVSSGRSDANTKMKRCEGGDNSFPVKDEEEPNDNDNDDMSIDVHHENAEDEVS